MRWPEFPGVTTDYCHVDAASMFFITNPERFDVVVTDNLFGDIITDIGAAIAGGIGRAASGNIDASRRHPSMFEPVHGSAPDIAGKGIADPTATVLSVAMMLDHLGQTAAAAEVEKAVSDDLAARGQRSGPPRDRRCTRRGGRAVTAMDLTMQASASPTDPARLAEILRSGFLPLSVRPDGRRQSTTMGNGTTPVWCPTAR